MWTLLVLQTFWLSDFPGSPPLHRRPWLCFGRVHAVTNYGSSGWWSTWKSGSSYSWVAIKKSVDYFQKRTGTCGSQDLGRTNWSRTRKLWQQKRTNRWVDCNNGTNHPGASWFRWRIRKTLSNQQNVVVHLFLLFSENGIDQKDFEEILGVTVRMLSVRCLNHGQHFVNCLTHVIPLYIILIQNESEAEPCLIPRELFFRHFLINMHTLWTFS